MARQKGIYQVKGSLGGASHYYMKKHGHVVRMKGGPTKEQIMKGKQFKRTRRNISEFSMASTAGKVIRHSVHEWTRQFGDSDVHSRLQAVMTTIKDFDTLSGHGKRHVRYGFDDRKAHDLLRDFAFREDHALSRTLLVLPVTDLDAGTVSWKGFCAREQLSYPFGATHVRLKCAFTAIHFGEESWDTVYGEGVVLPLDDAVQDVVLQVGHVPEGAELQVVFLLVELLQECGGLYRLWEGTVMGVVGVR